MNNEDEIWKTRDGRELKVGEMDEQHVRNALRMVLRNRRQMRKRMQAAPGAAAVLAILLRPFLKKMDAAEQAKLDEMNERFHQELLNDVMEDRKWGSD